MIYSTIESFILRKDNGHATTQLTPCFHPPEQSTGHQRDFRETMIIIIQTTALLALVIRRTSDNGMGGGNGKKKR